MHPCMCVRGYVKNDDRTSLVWSRVLIPPGWEAGGY